MNKTSLSTMAAAFVLAAGMFFTGGRVTEAQANDWQSTQSQCAAIKAKVGYNLHYQYAGVAFTEAVNNKTGAHVGCEYSTHGTKQYNLNNKTDKRAFDRAIKTAEREDKNAVRIAKNEQRYHERQKNSPYYQNQGIRNKTNTVRETNRLVREVNAFIYGITRTKRAWKNF